MVAWQLSLIGRWQCGSKSNHVVSFSGVQWERCGSVQSIEGKTSLEKLLITKAVYFKYWVYDTWALSNTEFTASWSQQC